MIKEFKQFIKRGNVLDMAVGLIMGMAFKSIVDSFVGDFIMPLISLLTGDINFSDQRIILRQAALEEDIVSLNYGSFIQTVINFLIISAVVFLMVKAMNKFRRKEAAEAETEPSPSREELVLVEIRDLLAKNIK